jgi:hypothetical protein
VAECKKIWLDVQETTKKKEAARRANAHATGGGPRVFSVILVNVLYHVKFCEEIQFTFS